MSTDSKVIIRMTMSLHVDENVIGLPTTTISESRSDYVMLPLELPYDGSKQSIADVNKRHLDYLAQCRDEAVSFLRPRLAETISEVVFNEKAMKYYHERWKLRPAKQHNPPLTDDQIRDRIGNPVWVEPIAKWGLIVRTSTNSSTKDVDPLSVIFSENDCTVKSFKLGRRSSLQLYDLQI